MESAVEDEQVIEEPSEEEPDFDQETPFTLTADIVAMRENGPLMVRWAPETRARLVMEFIKEHNLYASLNAFLRKRMR